MWRVFKCFQRSGWHCRIAFAGWLAVAGLSLAGGVALGQRPAEELRKSNEKYYAKWLAEDVVYIISAEEKAVFEKLTTDEEKDQFIEEFWRRRDPDPSTADNELKIEHYRRIAYANERYSSGVPGWKTDRGKIYIRFGPPNSTEKQPAGGPYKRRNSEGGGETTVFPFERWWYAHIDNVGDDIEIEFVDKSHSGEYRISINPNDKDAFLFAPGHGMTQAEMEGAVTRAQRIGSPLGVIDPNSPYLHRGDLPFERLERYAAMQRPPAIRFKQLEEIVTANVRYEQIPLMLRTDWLRMSQRGALVPITLGIGHRHLEFARNEAAVFEARVNFFGRVKNLQGKVVSIFEDEMVATKANGESLAEGKSLYQRILSLPPGRYRLDLVAEDTRSRRVGTLQTGFQVPVVEEGKLAASPVILVDQVQPIEESPDSRKAPDMFTLGTLKILPRLTNVLHGEKYLMFYFQLYNAAVQPDSLLPLLDLTYQIVENGAVVAEKKDANGSRANYVSNARIALLEYLNLDRTKADSLTLRILIADRVSGQNLTIEEPVRIER